MIGFLSNAELCSNLLYILTSLFNKLLQRKAPATAEEHLAAIQKMKEEKKLEKEQMKAMETPEEKRARRVAKKEAKALKNKQKSGWDDEYMG